jgi:hypothetical protein
MIHTSGLYRERMSEGIFGAPLTYQNNHVTLSHSNTDPSIVLVPHIKVASAILNVSDFFIFMEMSNA